MDLSCASVHRSIYVCSGLSSRHSHIAQTSAYKLAASLRGAGDLKVMVMKSIDVLRKGQVLLSSEGDGVRRTTVSCEVIREA